MHISHVIIYGLVPVGVKEDTGVYEIPEVFVTETSEESLYIQFSAKYAIKRFFCCWIYALIFLFVFFFFTCTEII